MGSDVKLVPVIWLTKGHPSKMHLRERGANQTLCGLLLHSRMVQWDIHNGECGRCATKAREQCS